MSEIKDYRQLTQEEIDTINSIKDLEAKVAEFWNEYWTNSNADKRWLSVAKTHFQEGFMAWTRSVAKPESPFN